MPNEKNHKSHKEDIKFLLKKLFPDLFYRRKITHYERIFKSAGDPAKYTKDKYRKMFNIDLNLDNPQTFYEKINFLKLFYDENEPEKLVDKTIVKAYLSSLGFEKHLAKMIASFNNLEDFKSFLKTDEAKHRPFVVKLNHSSGDVFFFNDGKWRNKTGEKINSKLVFAAIRNMLKFNYSHVDFQRVYENVKPSVLIEEYLPSPNQKGMDEFKLFCNYGDVRLINVVFGRQAGAQKAEAFTDKNLKIIPTKQSYNLLNQEEIYKPLCFEEMVDFCKKTISDRPMVRVDFMTDGTNFYFCEFTFYDCAGFNLFYPLEYNKIIGDLFTLKRQ